jgi:hypothetical protein
MRGGLQHALFRNDGGLRFSRPAVPALAEFRMSSTAAAWGDMDNDGDQDLVVLAAGVGSRLFRNDGEWRFESVSSSPLAFAPGGNQPAPLWGDFDNDGDLDLLIVYWGSAPSLYLNAGDGTLALAPFGTTGDLDRTITRKGGAALADYDGDGDLDLYVGNWPNDPGEYEANLLFRNESPPRAWSRVRLEGSRSNRSGIGARIRAFASVRGRGVWQTREVQSQATWRGQNDLAQQFGFDDATRIDTLEVRWPSGVVQRCTNLPVRQRILIVEGAEARTDLGRASAPVSDASRLGRCAAR